MTANQIELFAKKTKQKKKNKKKKQKQISSPMMVNDRSVETQPAEKVKYKIISSIKGM